MSEKERINCRACKHYYVTWDNNFPSGCRAYGIKSREIPALVIHKSSGEACKAYENKLQKDL